MKNLRFRNFIFLAFCMVLNLVFLVMMITSARYDRCLVTLSFFLVAWIPRIIRSVFHIDIPDRLETIYLIYVFAAHFLGSVVGLYSSISWFDMLMHFISGILTSFVALYVLNLFRKFWPSELWFPMFFMFCFSMMVAGCWEIMEFFSDLLFDGNTQHWLDTGVRDTMEDMIVAALGSLLTMSYYGYEHSVHGKGLFYYFMKELKGDKYGKKS